MCTSIRINNISFTIVGNFHLFSIRKDKETKRFEFPPCEARGVVRFLFHKDYK